jgi:penicillin-binding protein 1A
MTKKRRRQLIIAVLILGLASPAFAVAIASRLLGPSLRAHALVALHGVASDCAMGSDVDISLNGRIAMGPVDMEWPQGALVRHVQVRRLIITPVLGSLLSGTPRIGTVRADGVIVEIERVSRGGSAGDVAAAHGQLARQIAQQLAPMLRDHLSLVATDIYVHARTSDHDDTELTLASVEADAVCHGSCTGDAHVVFENGGELTVSATTETALEELAAFDDQVVSLTAHVIGLPLASLPTTLTQNFDRTHGQLDATASADLRFVAGRLASVDGTLGAAGKEIVIDASRLDDAPVTISAASAGAKLHYRVREKRLGIHDAFVGLGDDPRVRLRFDAAVDVNAPYATTIHTRAIGVPFDPLIAALPDALRPEAEDPKPHGELDAWADLDGPLADPAAWKLTGDIDVKAARADKATGAEKLRGAFTHHVVDDNGSPRDILVGLSNDNFVSLDDLPEHVVRAITTAEDGGFFGHHGFDLAEIQNSIAAVATAGKAVRGGSTITQQLAKNLYLTSAKTYSRKMREALIALALEGTLSKQRMLEIYVNVIEWGPSLYGIAPAARRYFGKEPTELNAKEAAYLASIIPNPVRYYGYYARGELSDTWNQRVNDILGKLHTTGVLDDAAYADAVTRAVLFAGR